VLSYPPLPIAAPTDLSSDHGWVSASRTRNYLLRDPLLDWLHLYGEDKGFVRDDRRPAYDSRTDLLPFLFAQGISFEQAVLACLATREDILTIAHGPEDVRSRTKLEETFRAMVNGAPVIAQAVMWNPTNRTYGMPDLLVRSDVLHAWFPEALSDEEAHRGARALGDQLWHYRVVDIKFTTLELDKNGHASSGHLPYMAQVFVYSEALGLLQGYTPPAGYLLGRGWSQRDERIRNCLDRLARVDLNYETPRGKQSLRESVDLAVAWIRRVRADGAGWDVIPDATVDELRPNMSNSKDQPWHLAKRQIAEAQGELTQIWQVAVDRRSAANAAGILRWPDPACTAAALGVTGAKQGPILDHILDINLSTDGPNVRPVRIYAAETEWRVPGLLEFFVDFETVNNLKDDFARMPDQAGQELIFMIGCGHIEDGQWQFASFITHDLSERSEADIIDAWVQHMEEVRRRLTPELNDPLVFHWSPAEVSVLESSYRSAMARHPGNTWPSVQWFDFLGKVVKVEPVVVRGAMAFGLKAVAKALYQHKLVETVWSDGPTDGLGAMVGAWWCEDEGRRLGKRLGELPLMQEIGRYNEVDCRAMMETIRYLRDHH
jgi:hypothetical protein